MPRWPAGQDSASSGNVRSNRLLECPPQAPPTFVPMEQGLYNNSDRLHTVRRKLSRSVGKVQRDRPLTICSQGAIESRGDLAADKCLIRIVLKREERDRLPPLTVARDRSQIGNAMLLSCSVKPSHGLLSTGPGIDWHRSGLDRQPDAGVAGSRGC